MYDYVLVSTDICSAGERFENWGGMVSIYFNLVNCGYKIFFSLSIKHLSRYLCRSTHNMVAEITCVLLHQEYYWYFVDKFPQFFLLPLLHL